MNPNMMINGPGMITPTSGAPTSTGFPAGFPAGIPGVPNIPGVPANQKVGPNPTPQQLLLNNSAFGPQQA